MAAALPDWMMLERFVFCRDTASFPDSEVAPFKADGTTSPDRSFSVAFRIHEPPGISRLYLQWLGGPKEGSPCDLVAAHRNLVLFRLAPDPVTLDKALFVDFREDHFICGAQSSPSQQPLLLRKIPKCDIPALLGIRDGKKVTTLRTFDLNPVSILCRGEEEFALAQLNFRRSNTLWGKMKAELCVLRSKVTNPRHKWKIEKWLPIRYEAHEIFDLDNWRTDRVIAFNKYLCWVNYGGGGILFCELFQQKPPIFYLRLPILNRCLHRRPLAFHETSRSVCVTRGSMGCDELRFIDIVRKDGKLIGPLGSGDKEGFTITCHALKITESGGMEWDMLFFMTCYELWTVNPSLPHKPLKHPVVSMSDPNVVHFLMSEHLPQIFDKISVVTVDMSTKEVLSTHAYINGAEDLKGQDADMVRRTAHFLQTFLPSELPKFLKSHQSMEEIDVIFCKRSWQNGRRQMYCDTRCEYATVGCSLSKGRCLESQSTSSGYSLQEEKQNSRLQISPGELIESIFIVPERSEEEPKGKRYELGANRSRVPHQKPVVIPLEDIPSYSTDLRVEVILDSKGILFELVLYLRYRILFTGAVFVLKFRLHQAFQIMFLCPLL